MLLIVEAVSSRLRALEDSYHPGMARSVAEEGLEDLVILVEEVVLVEASD